MIFHDAVYGGHAESASMQMIREERLKKSFFSFFIHPFAIILYNQTDVKVGYQSVKRLNAFVGQDDDATNDLDITLYLNGFLSIVQNSQQDRLNLCSVRLYGG